VSNKNLTERLQAIWELLAYISEQIEKQAQELEYLSLQLERLNAKVDGLTDPQDIG
jgi:cell division protein FtsB